MWNSLFIFKDTNNLDGLFLHEAERNFVKLYADLLIFEWKHLKFSPFYLDEFCYLGLYFIVGDSKEYLQVKLFILEMNFDSGFKVLLIILHDFSRLFLLLHIINDIFQQNEWMLHEFDITFLEPILDMLIELIHQTDYLALSGLKVDGFVEVKVKDEDELTQLLNHLFVFAV